MAQADEENAKRLTDDLSRLLDTAIGPDDLADTAAYQAAALASWEGSLAVVRDEWAAHPDIVARADRSVSANTVTSFAGLINERRQRALGIEQYIWRSSDDTKRVATSAKTLNATALTYFRCPALIYYRLKSYVYRIDSFSVGGRNGFDLTASMIEKRRLILAVPFDTKTEQIVQIQRAIDYAKTKEIELIVQVIK